MLHQVISNFKILTNIMRSQDNTIETKVPHHHTNEMVFLKVIKSQTISFHGMLWQNYMLWKNILIFLIFKLPNVFGAIHHHHMYVLVYYICIWYINIYTHTIYINMCMHQSLNPILNINMHQGFNHQITSRL